MSGKNYSTDVTMMKRDPFSQDVNEIYCVISGTELYKFKLFTKHLDPDSSDKEPSFSK
jgi:hypothetical protein